MQLREEVKVFAEEMEVVLRIHDTVKGERGWDNETIEMLLIKLMEEVGELAQMVFSGEHNTYPGFAAKEAIDIGNVSMMLYNKLMSLPPYHVDSNE